MELRQLRHFLAVADSRSFTVAATELRISQPALSQSIARLERELDCTLFLRNKQNPGVGLLLTPAGESLLVDGGSLVRAAHRAEERARRAGHSHLRPPVAVGFTSSTPQHLVSAALAESTSGADVIPVQLEWGHEHEAIEQGLVDLAYLQYPGGTIFSGHEVRRIMEVPRIALVPVGHRLAERASVNLADLAGEPILDPGFTDGPDGFREYWLGNPRPHDAPIGRIVGPPVKTVDEMCNFVAAGRGLAIVSDVLATRYLRPDLVFLPVEGLSPIEVGIAKLSEDLRPHIAEVFARLGG
jgi:DNA-binding transcriptional LysR family regulator